MARGRSVCPWELSGEQGAAEELDQGFVFRVGGRVSWAYDSELAVLSQAAGVGLPFLQRLRKGEYGT